MRGRGVRLHKPTRTAKDCPLMTYIVKRVTRSLTTPHFLQISNCHLKLLCSERSGFVRWNFSASPESSRPPSEHHLPRTGLLTALLSFVNTCRTDGSRFSSAHNSSLVLVYRMSTRIFRAFTNHYLINRLTIRFHFDYREQRTNRRIEDPSVESQITAG